jgi:hypothetical protein
MDANETPLFLRFGGAPKSSFEMNDQELAEAAASILKRAKEKAFSKGLPIFFSLKDKVFAEYPDGKIEEIQKRA